MGIVAWILVGFVAGVLARAATDTERRGLVFSTIVGIAGGVIGGLLFHLVTGEGLDGFSLYSIFVAFLGAVGLLWVAGRIRRR